VSIPHYANGKLSYSDFVQSDQISFNGMIKQFDQNQQTELRKLRQTFKKREDSHARYQAKKKKWKI